MEVNHKDRLNPVATIYEKGISLGVMSKAIGLAGLRIGWIAT
jgi:histidinol-phosphate/aromatic aminotransferase/cobyric acid decarboxylase-like protein